MLHDLTNQAQKVADQTPSLKPKIAKMLKAINDATLELGFVMIDNDTQKVHKAQDKRIRAIKRLRKVVTDAQIAALNK